MAKKKAGGRVSVPSFLRTEYYLSKNDGYVRRVVTHGSGIQMMSRYQGTKEGIWSNEFELKPAEEKDKKNIPSQLESLVKLNCFIKLDIQYEE